MQQSYVVEAIISHTWVLGVKGGYKYQIKCEGYDDDEMTWDPAANLSQAKRVLDDYKKQHKLGETKVKQNRND